MALKMWSLDVAREQAPTFDHLARWAHLSLDHGYDALGLYLEHRFAWECAPWAGGVGALKPGTVRALRSEFPSLRIIPMINLLGHFEGFLHTESGQGMRETRLGGMQGCPSYPDFVRLTEAIVEEALAVFDDEILHLGGDETADLAVCPRCSERPKAEVYAEHFAPLIERVERAGRRPALWGDMLLEHPSVLDALSKRTLIFDWQYFGGLTDSAPTFTSAGFEVVGCPTLQAYNAPWLYVRESDENIRRVASDVAAMDLTGVCLTTWEATLFGPYDALEPAIARAGQVLNGRDPDPMGPWEELIGVELPLCGRTFAHSTHRSRLRGTFLLGGNPFLLWREFGEDLVGEAGDRALPLLDRAQLVAEGEAQRGITIMLRSAIEFARIADQCRREYAAGRTEAACTALAPARYLWDRLASIAHESQVRVGGSRADAERCHLAKEHVERVIRRIRRVGDGSLGYLPSFDHLTDLRFVPHDQGAWWRVNAWTDR
ncbi:MAG TPA: family 20 glycosylhydrolase [Fimbriimonadaceae bacterium]|nr:family 20 glycosylhydrolase [Fimbriimonadaceae bacterium]